jgi:hypothetical protein
MSEIWVWQFGGKMLTNTEVLGEKIPAASSALSTTNPAWIILGSNPSLLDARQCSVTAVRISTVVYFLSTKII